MNEEDIPTISPLSGMIKILLFLYGVVFLVAAKMRCIIVKDFL